MKLLMDGRVAYVTLSRRNLLAMLHKLDTPGSYRTLMKQMDDGMILTLRGEDDDEHYLQEEPGAMHPQTEIYISERSAK